MNKKLVLGLVIVALVIGGLFLMGAIPVEDSNVSMDITFYDVDGNELGKATTAGFSMFGIRRPGVEGDIHFLTVAISFTVTTDIENIGVVTKAWVGVVTRLNTITGGLVHEIAEEYVGRSAELEDTLEVTYLMSYLLPASAIESTGKANGWKMSFNARLETVLTRPDWTQRTVEDTCSIKLDLSWSEQLNLDSYIALP